MPRLFWFLQLGYIVLFFFIISLFSYDTNGAEMMSIIIYSIMLMFIFKYYWNNGKDRFKESIMLYQILTNLVFFCLLLFIYIKNIGILLVLIVAIGLIAFESYRDKTESKK